MRHLLLLTILFIDTLTVSAKTGKEIIIENGFKPKVTPMLTTKWAQAGGGENSLLPNIRNSDLAKTGCGATALAQIMKYWNYPKAGFGCNSYTWQHPYTYEYFSRFCNFSESYYDWDDMIDVYVANEERTQKEIDAVAKLMYDIGIALEMKYRDGSTATQIEYISTALKKFWRYNPYLRVLRFTPGGYTKDEWLAIIYRELSEGRPILMGANTSSFGRHIFVLDGYNEEGLVHINMGHAKDKENTFYDLYSSGLGNMRMIIGISPQEIPVEIKNVQILEPGSIIEAMGGETAAKKLSHIKVTGKLNKEDIYALRRLCRADVDQADISDIGQLSYVDFSEAYFEDNEIPDNAFFFKDQNDNTIPCYTLQTVILPNSLKRIGHNAFRSCLGLQKINIPSTLEIIGNMAFWNCRYLDNLFLPKTVKTIGQSAFSYAKADSFNIETGNANYYIENNTLFTSDGKKIIAYVGKENCDYIIPEGVEKIEGYTFGGKANLLTLTLPKTLKVFSIYPFDNCGGFTDIYSYATVPDIWAELMYWLINNNWILHVPIGYKQLYVEAYNEAYETGWDEIRARYDRVGTIVEDIDIELLEVKPLSSDSRKKSCSTIFDINGIKRPSSSFNYCKRQLFIVDGKFVYR